VINLEQFHGELMNFLANVLIIISWELELYFCSVKSFDIIYQFFNQKFKYKLYNSRLKGFET